jgi:Domain of unknown function (DUF6259)
MMNDKHLNINLNQKIMKTFKEKIIYLFFLGIFSFFLTGCNNGPEGEIIFLENDKMELGFDKKTGSLIVFKDIVNSHNYLDENTSPESLWEIQLVNGSEIETIDIAASSKFQFSKRNNSLVLTWKNFSGRKNKDFKVKAVVTLEEDKALSSWKISVNGTEGETLNRVIFPKIAGIKDLGDEYLAVPTWQGNLVKNPRSILSERKSEVKSFNYGYPGPLSLQCVTLYDSKVCGFYASSNDTLAYRKEFSFTLDTQDNLTYQINNFPALDPELDSYEPPYEAIIGSFKGDWITAAELYREWGTKQRWSKESRFKNKLVAPWLEETAIWVWNRGKSDNVLVPAADLKQRLGLPVNVFWHWWHGCSYDDGFPEYVPPREGKESFVKAMKTANDKGVRAIVYMNSYQWGDSTKSWKDENASLWAVKDFNGNLRSHVFNIFTGKSLTNMCMATQFWKDKYSSLSDSCINTYHTNGVYMDQACQNKLCYDPTHGHPIGGGNYWVENFSTLTDMIRSKIPQNNPIALAGEGCGEAWIPILDAMLTLQVSRERYAGVGPVETIPFFQAVYHEYAISYGSYSSLIVPPYDELWPKEFAPKDPLKLLSKDFNKQYLMEQAKSFVWGMQPTLANYQSFLASKRKDEIDYLMNLAKVRYKGLKYLLYGKFMRSPDIDIPEKEINISRLSIYAGKRGESVTAFHKTVPVIYTGTWKSEDNQVGIALASISDDPQKVSFTMNSKDYELPPSGEIYIIDIEGRKKLTDYSNDKIEVNYTIPDKGLCIVELVPNK